MFAAIAVALLTLADPVTVQVEHLKFTPGDVVEGAKVEVRVKEKGEAVTYRGVPLRSLLADQLKGGNAMADLRALSDAVILVRATDGYQAAFSAAEVAMDKTGERYLLAATRNGKPLDASQGTVKLIVPGDSEHVRWVRLIEQIDLVRLPKPKK